VGVSLQALKKFGRVFDVAIEGRIEKPQQLREHTASHYEYEHDVPKPRIMISIQLKVSLHMYILGYRQLAIKKGRFVFIKPRPSVRPYKQRKESWQGKRQTYTDDRSLALVLLNVGVEPRR
jgi:hypothetical protein